MEHHHHTHSNPRQDLSQKQLLKLSVSATWHCLVGCGLGEVAGMIISTAAGMNNFYSIVLAASLAMIAGLALGILPLREAGFSTRRALQTVVAAEGLSILVMETFQIFTELAIPGVMSAHLTDLIFWIGMIAALAVGFIAAFPVNYIFIRRGIRHMH